MKSYFVHNNMNSFFSLVVYIPQVCFLPACHFLLKVFRVRWPLDSLVHHWWVMAVCALFVYYFFFMGMCLCQIATFVLTLTPFLSTGGPPYPPNQYGGGRGNYDNFRGQGGYLGKPRNIRWDHCTCDLYFACSCLLFFCYWRIVKLHFFMIFFYSSFLGLCFSLCTVNHLRMSRGDPRNIIEYRDLDAPDDMDFF